ncbi:MAG: hypothetical protein M3308_00500 [Actinomycetota bacterium]|nr:hypothetical protein [Actinomycetota bacterium]
MLDGQFAQQQRQSPGPLVLGMVEGRAGMTELPLGQCERLGLAGAEQPKPRFRVVSCGAGDNH